MFDFIVARRPCGCPSAITCLSVDDDCEYVGMMVLNAFDRGDTITHERAERMEFHFCPACRKEPTDAPQA